MSDLSSLIARLEKAEGPSRDLDAYIHFRDRVSRIEKIAAAKTGHINIQGSDFSGGTVLLGENVPVYTSSIDAAVSLATRVLPGWGWGVESKTHHIMACLNPEFGEPVGKHPHWAAISNVSTRTFEDAATPAMALVLATLRALQQKGGTE